MEDSKDTLVVTEVSTEEVINISLQEEKDSLIPIELSTHEEMSVSIQQEEAQDILTIAEVPLDSEMNISIQQDEEAIEAVVLTDDPLSTVDMTDNIIIHKGYSPFFNTETNTWFEYSNSLQAFVDTGVGINSTIDVATTTKNGLLSAEDKIKINQLKTIAFTGDFSDLTGFKTLKIGTYTFNGTTDVNIPVYAGGGATEPIEEQLFQMNLVNSTSETYTMNLE